MLLLAPHAIRAAVVKGGLPWFPGAADPPTAATPDGWHYFTPQEAATVEALVDRLIPADELSPGGKDCGCAVFIDRQLAGPYGRSEADYRSGPFQQGTKQQGPQSQSTPAQAYRKALAALDAACLKKYDGKNFAQLADEQKDETIKGLEDGSLKLDGGGESFFKLILNDTQQGFFADPIYGGNKDMVAWKMIGFPGARYDYSDWVERHNERYPFPPISVKGNPDWSR